MTQSRSPGRNREKSRTIPGSCAQQFAVRAFLCNSELKIVFDLHGDRGPIEHLDPALLEAIRVAIEGVRVRVKKEEMFEEE